MTAADNKSAMAALAADLGSAMAHTGDAAGGAAAADLFGDLDAEAAAHDQATIQPMRRGRGRPPGSRSRSTQEMARWLANRGYRDPAEFLAAIVSADTRGLARDLGLDEPLEALKAQIRAAEALMPYMHQKTPTQLEHRSESARPLIVLMDGGHGATGGVGAGGATISAFDLIDQELSAIEASSIESKSHGDKSYDET